MLVSYRIGRQSWYKKEGNNKGKCNSPIFRPFVGHCVQNIGLLNYFLPFYNTIAFRYYTKIFIENVFYYLYIKQH